MEFLKSLTFTMVVLVLGVACIILGLVGDIDIGSVHIDVGEWIPRAGLCVLGAILIVVSLLFELRTRRSIPKDSRESQVDKAEQQDLPIRQEEHQLPEPLGTEQRADQRVPEIIQQYLKDFPEFNVDHDIRADRVRTSRESFMAVARMVYQSLRRGEEVFGTDCLSFDRDIIRYWVTEGLEYLKINHEASLRGIQITRVFVVGKQDFLNHQPMLTELGRLQALAGVRPRVALYDELPRDCRYEFVLLGDHFVDEVVYDMRSNDIINNYIHWSNNQMAAFRARARIIEAYVDHDWVPSGRPQARFDDIINFAQKIKKTLGKEQ